MSKLDVWLVLYVTAMSFRVPMTNGHLVSRCMLSYALPNSCRPSVAEYLTIIHRRGGEKWWIFDEPRSGEVNISHSSPTPR